MEHAKKMVLVSADEAGMWKEPMIGGGGGSGTRVPTVTLPSVQTPGDPISRLDEELSEILHSKKYRDDSEKWKQYLQVLHRYLFLLEVRKGPIDPTLPGATSGTSREQQTSQKNVAYNDALIIDSVPQTYRHKAKALVSYLRNSPGAVQRVTWDQEGRVTIDGKLVPDSNIVDLINDAIRSRKEFQAEGRRQFIETLRAISIPREFIGNAALWTLGTARRNVKRARKNWDDDNDDVANYSDEEAEEEVGATTFDIRATNKEKRSDIKSVERMKTRASREEAFNTRRGVNVDKSPKRTEKDESKKKKSSMITDTVAASPPIDATATTSRSGASVEIPRGFAHWLKL